MGRELYLYFSSFRILETLGGDAIYLRTLKMLGTLLNSEEDAICSLWGIFEVQRFGSAVLLSINSITNS